MTKLEKYLQKASESLKLHEENVITKKKIEKSIDKIVRLSVTDSRVIEVFAKTKKQTNK